MKTFLLKKINQNKNKHYDVIFLYFLIFVVEFLFFNLYTLFFSILIISLYTTYKLDKQRITFTYLIGTNILLFYTIVILFNLYQINNFNEEHLYKKNSQMFFKENYFISDEKEIFIRKNNEDVSVKTLDLKNKSESELFFKYLSNKELNLIIEKRTYKFNYGFYLREETFFNLI